MEQTVDIPARGGFKVTSQARVLPHQVDCLTTQMLEFKGFPHFSQPQKSAEVTRRSSPRVPANASSSELNAHQKALARESDELADEPGGALDDATADLQRGLRREGGERRRRCSLTMWRPSPAMTEKGVRRAFLPVHRQ